VKAQILVDTRRSETQYQKQLQQARREQANIESEVVSIEKQLREKMKEGERLKKLQILGSPNFNWPVSRNTITAFFHDPDYPYRYIFEHPAVDISARQGSPVRAAAGGYVAKAKNVCNGYAYVMVIHDKGYATVYGHLSKIQVSDDDFIEQGQVIGLSGGMPRTCGSGNLTTGPHLHFEVRREGIPVNPLDYLP
jgi:murein DD-endopeptidase MepM/ murein hydrolase activator NlpD